MSRSNWINELVDAGYDAGVLDTLNNNELAELVHEEYVENTWSPEARAAARAIRKRNKRLPTEARNKIAEAVRQSRAKQASSKLMNIPGKGSETHEVESKKVTKEYKNKGGRDAPIARIPKGFRFRKGT